MNRRLAASALVLSVLLPFASLKAVAPTTQPVGTITGTVLKDDGTPAAKVEVRVTAAPAGGKKAKAAVQGKKNAPVATATTKDDGTFSVDVPPGSYNLTVGKKTDALVGKGKAVVVEGQTVDVKITLAKPAATPAK
jgi:Carboxypeptidase regulatory-like domain